MTQVEIVRRALIDVSATADVLATITRLPYGSVQAALMTLQTARYAAKSGRSVIKPGSRGQECHLWMITDAGRYGGPIVRRKPAPITPKKQRRAEYLAEVGRVEC